MCWSNLVSILHDTFDVLLHSFYAPDVSILHMVRMADNDRLPLPYCDQCMFHGNIGCEAVTNPLIACAIAPVVPAEHPITEMYEPYICSDGSLIAKAQICDGIVDCFDEEDEANCHYVCSSPTHTCFSECVHPHCISFCIGAMLKLLSITFK